MLTDNKRKLVFDSNGKFIYTTPIVLNDSLIVEDDFLKSDE